MATNPFDTQVGGSHYKDMKIQPVEFIVANGLSFLEGNAIKYICRHRAKHGVQDIEKAIHYLEMIRDEYRKNTADPGETIEAQESHSKGFAHTGIWAPSCPFPYIRN